jgi:hypothetical protein
MKKVTTGVKTRDFHLPLLRCRAVGKITLYIDFLKCRRPLPSNILFILSTLHSLPSLLPLLFELKQVLGILFAFLPSRYNNFQLARVK